MLKRMPGLLPAFFILVLTLIPSGGPSAVHAAQSERLEISHSSANVQFPTIVDFTMNVESDLGLSSVVLEYGVEKDTCAGVTAKAFPDIPTDYPSNVWWIWDMRKSGSVPPGATLWYRWHVTDKARHEVVTEKETVLWINSDEDWNALTKGMLTIHTYKELQSYNQELLDSASASLDDLAKTTGVAPTAPIEIYVFNGSADLKAAILYEPGWTGAMAFPNSNIVIAGIAFYQIAWGKSALAHELTHVLVGHLARSCLGNLPTWLDEGLAVYGQGGPEPESVERLHAAISKDTLIPLGSLMDGFSELSDKADLSYAESHSMVSYLIKTHGRDKLLALLGHIAEGQSIEGALQAVYGFGLDGLEDGWRQSVGARPVHGEGTATGAGRTSTPVPTYALVSAAAMFGETGISVVPPIPPGATDQSTGGSEDVASSWPVLLAFLMMCLVALFLGVWYLRTRLGRKA